jgi:hypothetical protein
VVTGAFALAALSLLAPSALAFDPMAWLVWGRETTRLALDTSSGPSWKPFPVLFTTPFALFGGAAPALWLVVARAGGLLAVAGTYALAARLGGRWAGVAGAVAMALSPWWAYHTALGNSEGLLAAAVVWAVYAHLAGHRRAALALMTAAALMRPEAWPFLLGYGIWLWRAERRAVIVAAVVVPLLWIGPDVIGAGGALGASHTALGGASPESAKNESIPALAVFGDTADVLTLPALVATVIAAIAGGPLARWIAAAAAGWVVIVAAMTLAGYAGNPRYLVAAAALGAALAGAGAVRAAGAAGAAVLVAAVLASTVGTLRDQAAEVADRADSAAAFDGVITAAGGRDALVRCARIRTSASARSLVAWRLDLPLREIDATPIRPAVVIRARWFYGAGLEPPRTPGYRTLATSPDWQVIAACRR